MKILRSMFAAGFLLAGISSAQAISVTDTVSDFCNLGAAGVGVVCRNDSLNISLATPTAALGNGTLTLTLFGDYNTTPEFVTVNIEGTDFGSIFNNINGDDPFDLNPDTGSDTNAITVTAAIANPLLTSLINDGLFTLSFTFSNGGTSAQDTVNNINDGANGEFITATLDFDEATTAPVPVPAAVWLFGSALLGLIGMKKKKA